MIKKMAACVSLIIAMAGAALAAPAIGPGQYDSDADSVTIPFHLVNQEGKTLSAIGIDVTYNADAVEAPTAIAGQSASAAGKKLTAKVTAPGKLRVAIFGMNTNTIEDGNVAVLTFHRKPESARKPLNLGFSASASDKSGNLVTLGN